MKQHEMNSIFKKRAAIDMQLCLATLSVIIKKEKKTSVTSITQFKRKVAWSEF